MNLHEQNIASKNVFPFPLSNKALAALVTSSASPFCRLITRPKATARMDSSVKAPKVLHEMR